MDAGCRLPPCQAPPEALPDPLGEKTQPPVEVVPWGEQALKQVGEVGPAICGRDAVDAGPSLGGGGGGRRCRRWEGGGLTAGHGKLGRHRSRGQRDRRQIHSSRRVGGGLATRSPEWIGREHRRILSDDSMGGTEP